MMTVPRLTILATVMAALLTVAQRIDPLKEGLVATYFVDANWSAAPVMAVLDPSPSTTGLLDAWHGHPPETFSTTWNGSFIIISEATYTFATTSDDGSWVYVDGELVVDNSGHHTPLAASGTKRLRRGVHEIFIRYFQDGGSLSLALSSARDDGPLEPIPSWTLSARHAEFSRTLASVVLRRASTAAIWLWLATLLVAATTVLRPRVERSLRWIWIDPIRRALALLVVASCVLNAIGITWGVPSTWAGDELTPKTVLIALSQGFSGGWFGKYPPLHFYTLSAAYAPWLLMRSSGLVHVSDRASDAVLFVLGRLVSVAYAAGTLIAIYTAAAQLFGRRAGAFAAASMAVLSVFVFYAKTANPEVPYVFWFAVSAALYVRAIRTLALADIVLFACAATLAICTKDQAYALYLSVPIVLTALLVRECGVRAVTDRRLWLAGAAAVILFVTIQNVPLNARGFVSHIRYVTGPGSWYRVFEPTLAGQLSLLRLTVDLDRRSWGWPLFVTSLAGLVLAVANRKTRFVSICLLLIVASYYLTFIAVILYNYDRYLLPMCAVQAIFAGVALDRMVGPWRSALVAAVFTYTSLYAATVDVLMLRDSRYVAEQWLLGHVAPGQLVATIFTDVTEPRMEGFNSIDIGTLENLRRWKPDYFVVNADYARAVESGTPPGELVAGLQRQTLGYRLAFHYRTPAPWPWLPAPHPDLVGPRLDAPVFSFLRDINPAIEIYERAP
jgi:PA14 domain-containing protein/dolichyl-phosphate-mannose-protein mannosyltransferase